HLAAKIRVYELARELGLTNKEMLDLAESLGIGVKSHSSSIEEAQADRARRKADREGLRREVQPEEPDTKKKAAKKAAAPPAEAKPKVEPAAEPAPAPAAGDGATPDRGAPLEPAAREAVPATPATPA